MQTRKKDVSMDEPKTLKNKSLRESEWDLSFWIILNF